MFLEVSQTVCLHPLALEAAGEAKTQAILSPLI